MSKTEDELLSKLHAAIALSFDWGDLTKALRNSTSLGFIVPQLPSGPHANDLSRATTAVEKCCELGILGALEEAFRQAHDEQLHPELESAFDALRRAAPHLFDGRAGPSLDIDPLVCLIDRSEQVSFFVDAIDGADYAKLVQRGCLLFSSALTVDQPNALWKRIREHTISANWLSKDTAMRLPQKTVAWGSSKTQVMHAVKNAVCGHPQASDEELAAVIRSNRYPIVLHCDLSEDNWLSPDKCSSTLTEVCEHWAGLTTGGHLALMIFSVLESPPPPPAGWTLGLLSFFQGPGASQLEARRDHLRECLTTAAARFGIGGKVMPPFGLINFNHVRTWLNSDEVVRMIRQPNALLGPLQSRVFTSEVAPGLRLEAVITGLMAVASPRR